MKVGAPAVVMLATIVNVAAAAPALAHDMSGSQNLPADLSWALKGGATHAAQSTRAYIARKAATSIHSLDRLSGAQAHVARCAAVDVPLDPCACLRVDPSRDNAQFHTLSSFQHSAP
jgi:hypothetical protein